MEPKVSELPKGLVLVGGGHVHIRHRGFTPLSDMGSNTMFIILACELMLNCEGNR